MTAPTPDEDEVSVNELLALADSAETNANLAHEAAMDGNLSEAAYRILDAINSLAEAVRALAGRRP